MPSRQFRNITKPDIITFNVVHAEQAVQKIAHQLPIKPHTVHAEQAVQKLLPFYPHCIALVHAEQAVQK